MLLFAYYSLTTGFCLEMIGSSGLHELGPSKLKQNIQFLTQRFANFFDKFANISANYLPIIGIALELITWAG